MALHLLRFVAGVGVALWMLGAGPIHAAWPSAIVISGGSLAQPVVLGPKAIADSDRYLFLYGRSTGTISATLSDRPYFRIAIYWGGDVWSLSETNPAALANLKPEEAMQHGRLYPPAGTEPAVVIATPYMAGSPCGRGVGAPRRGEPHPVPADVRGFPCGWVLTASDIDVLRELGVPGFTPSGTLQSATAPSIEGRWTISTGEYLPGAIPADLVISVDRDRIYGMVGDFQIRGTVKEQTFSFDADWPEHPLTFNGTLQSDGTLRGRLTLTSSPASDGSRLKKSAPWTATRVVRR